MLNNGFPTHFELICFAVEILISEWTRNFHRNNLITNWLACYRNDFEESFPVKMAPDKK